MKLQNIIEEIKALRGSTVSVFGQPQTIETEIHPLTIDIIDVLENLKELETTKLSEVEDVEAWLDELENTTSVVYGKSDNSYNWCSPVSNDFNFYSWYDEYNDITYITFKVHKFGDVRGNYTDSCILRVDGQDLYSFYELLSESNKYDSIEVEDMDFGYTINIFNDRIEVDSNEHSCFEVCASDMEELKEEIKSNI